MSQSLKYGSIHDSHFEYIQTTITSLVLGRFWKVLHQNKWFAKHFTPRHTYSLQLILRSPSIVSKDRKITTLYLCMASDGQYIEESVKMENTHTQLIHTDLPHTKPTKWPVCPAKTQISLGIHFFMRKMKTDQTGRTPRLIWVFAGCTGHFVGFVMWQLTLIRILS